MQQLTPKNEISNSPTPLPTISRRHKLCRQLRWLTGDRTPFAVTLKLTARCTLHCRHCPWLDHQYPDLPTEKWKEIILNFRNQGTRNLVLEGGEPTLRGDLQELINCGHTLGMDVTVATNCTLPLNAYTPHRFFISIDGLKDAHDKLRGPGAFDLLLKNLPTARKKRVALVSLSRDNAHQIDDILSFFSSRLEEFWFSFVYDYNNKEGIALSAEEKKSLGVKLLALQKHYPIINLPSYLRSLGTPRQCKEWALVTVTADAVTQPGCMVRALEPCLCDECELACQRELSDLVSPKGYWHYLCQ